MELQNSLELPSRLTPTSEVISDCTTVRGGKHKRHCCFFHAKKVAQAPSQLGCLGSSKRRLVTVLGMSHSPRT